MHIGWVTCAAEVLKNFFPTSAEPNFIPSEPSFTPDDQIAVDILRSAGHHIGAIIWGTALHTLPTLDLLIIRSPWDYMQQQNHHLFFCWLKTLQQLQIPIANPINFMQWLLDKHYLQDLQAHAINVIPTIYLPKGTNLDLRAYFFTQGSFILKPCIAAAGVGLYFIQNEQDAISYQVEVNEQLQQQDYMLQEFITDITEQGEWSCIFLGGKYSHAIHKKPAIDSIFVHAERGGSLTFTQPPPLAVVEFAQQTYQKLFTIFKNVTGESYQQNLLLYLRLDIINTQQGPVLIECEGVEPELFFRAHPPAAQQFCKAVHNILYHRK